MARRRASREERFVYGSVLDALSQGLYPDKRHVIREFVQNACDAVREYERKAKKPLGKPISVSIQKPSITIYDEGVGMGRRTMEQYRYVGYSEKEMKENVGFRGIGTVSGIAVAERIIATSTQLGTPKRFTVVINAQGMLAELEGERNPPLEELLGSYTEVSEEKESANAHYTLVELHGIRADSAELYDTDTLSHYLRGNLPVPFDPSYPHGTEVSERLRLHVPGYFETAVTLAGKPLYKQYPGSGLQPEYEFVLVDDASSELLAYCWYSMHADKGQYPKAEPRGLVYRFKNFAVGSPLLTRETLWDSTPHRAFYFFGEIHVLDSELTPSSDRTNFEDNAARKRTFARCKRIARILNRKAARESDQRRFAAVLAETQQALSQREEQIETGGLPADMREGVQYQVRAALMNVSKRRKRTEGRRDKTRTDKRLIAKGKKIESRATRLLGELSETGEESKLYDIKELLPMGEDAQAVYDAVMDVLKVELAGEPERLEHIVTAVHERLQLRFAESH